MKSLKCAKFLLLFVFQVATSPVEPLAGDNLLRLPKTSFPLSYDLSLITMIHTGTREFTGNVKINVEIKELTNTITLHNRGLTIQSVSVKHTVGKADVPITISIDVAREFLIIESVSEDLQNGGLYLIEINFTGQLQIGTSGFYRSWYTVDGRTR